MRRLFLFSFLLAASFPTPGRGQIPTNPSETFAARAEATTLTIHIDRYTNDSERRVAAAALASGASAGFTAQLRGTPSVGYVEVGSTRWAIRYARQEPTSKGRRVVVVLDQPLVLPGSVEVALKPRAGFDLAVIHFEVDETGTGQGTIAAAARVQAVGPTGVEITNDSDAPMRPVTVAKVG